MTSEEGPFSAPTKVPFLWPSDVDRDWLSTQSLQRLREMLAGHVKDLESLNRHRNQISTLAYMEARQVKQQVIADLESEIARRPT